MHLYSTQGEIHLYLGEWGQAEESFRRGLTLAEELGSLERQAGYRGGLALAARGQNDLNSGIQLLNEALALIADQGYWHLRTRLQLWLAEILFDQDNFAEANKLIEEAVAIARTHQRTLLLVQAQRLQARLLATTGENASSLGLRLEIARVQAAWGETALKHSATPERGRELISAARVIFIEHNARADLVVCHG